MPSQKRTPAQLAKLESHDREMLIACYDTAQDMAIIHDLEIATQLLPTALRGRFQLIAAAFHVRKDGTRVRVHRYIVEYPNGQATTLSSAVFHALIKLDAMMSVGPRIDPETALPE